MRPMERYRQAVLSGSITADPAQAAVMEKLDRIQSQLTAQPRAGGWWQRLVARWQPEPPVARGLYIWGGVGRGKTMLMDWFFAGLAPGMGLRMHFHRFMQRVHHDLDTFKGIANPLHKVADGFAAEGQVLCFDEFFVSDIGDAMLLAELMKALFERGVLLVATSNVEPKRLYENGLQRSRFLPAIDLIETSCDVHWLDGPVDYRLRVLEKAELFHWPLDADADESLLRSFQALATDAPMEKCRIDRRKPNDHRASLRKNAAISSAGTSCSFDMMRRRTSACWAMLKDKGDSSCSTIVNNIFPASSCK